ncbi:hypothetical protein ACFE04_031706 [Oxalis oulophora]
MAQLCVDLDGDQVQVVDQWTHKYHVTFDDLINKQINNQEIRSMLFFSMIPTNSSYVIRNILECAYNIASSNNKNDHSVLGIDVHVLIFEEDKTRYLGENTPPTDALHLER